LIKKSLLFDFNSSLLESFVVYLNHRVFIYEIHIKPEQYS
jgi:hypothetical protein